MRAKLHIPPDFHGKVLPYDRQRQPPWTGPAHQHDEIEVNLVTRGHARLLAAGRTHHLAPGTLAWLFPAQPHLFTQPSDDFAMWVGLFRPRLLEEYRPAMPQFPSDANPSGLNSRQLGEAATKQLVTLFQRLHSIDTAAHLNPGLAWLLLECWHHHETTHNTPDSTRLHPAVERMAHLLRRHPEVIKLEDLAPRAGLSLGRLSRLFHQQMGLTLVEFRQRQRLQRFLQIYGHGQRLNLMQAAYEAGFQSYAQFYRVLRQILGHSPKDLRRK